MPLIVKRCDNLSGHGAFKLTFPAEIVDNIAFFIVGDGLDFSKLAQFSLACYQFRQVAFRHYFATLRIRTKYQWFRQCRIPGVFLWTRTIHCNSTALYLRPDMLREFVHLESASLSFHAEGRNTQHTSTKLILKNLPPKLTHLTLERLPLVDSYLIGVVAARLPNLRSLKLTCADRLDPDLACCWTCYEESGSHTIHSPMPNFYIGIDDLVDSLGPSLEPLCYLEELFLGIYLSDEAIFYDHIIHSEDITQPFAEPYGPDECLICDELHADSVRDTEILASINIATYLPRLKSISWSSFFAKDLPGDDPDQQRTTIWLKRDGDKIRVRRSKW